MYMYVYYNLIYSQSHIFKHVCTYEAALLMNRYIINTLYEYQSSNSY